MFNVHQSKKFQAMGGANQEIGLNPFAIRKNVDVKRLKTQLWDHIQPILEFKRAKPQASGDDMAIV
jgi:hypothetical protein